MKCIFCKIDNVCARCGKEITELGRNNIKEKKSWCIPCFKILLEEEREVIEDRPAQRIRRTGGQTKIDKRIEADKFFDKTMNKLESLGAGNKRRQTVNENGVNDQIRHLQREAQKAINVKMADNKRRGRTYGDGNY